MLKTNDPDPSGPGPKSPRDRRTKLLQTGISGAADVRAASSERPTHTLLTSWNRDYIFLQRLNEYPKLAFSL